MEPQRHPQRSTRWRAVRSLAAAKRCTHRRQAPIVRLRVVNAEWRCLLERQPRTARRTRPVPLGAEKHPTALGVSSRRIVLPIETGRCLTDAFGVDVTHCGRTVLRLREPLEIEARAFVPRFERVFASARSHPMPLRHDLGAACSSTVLPMRSALSVTLRNPQPVVSPDPLQDRHRLASENGLSVCWYPVR